MKRSLSIFIIAAMLFLLSSCQSGKMNGIEVEHYEDSGNGKEKILLNITYADDFSNGFAWITCNPNNQGKCRALINTNGEIITTLSTDYSTSPMGKEACEVYDSKNKICEIINNKGEKVASSLNGEFDIICASGDDMFLVYKYISSVDSPKHLFGTVDSKGNFVRDLTEYNLKLQIDRFGLSNKKDYLKGNTEYLGAGMFGIVYNTHLDMCHYIVFSSKTGQFFNVNSYKYSDDPFIGIKDKIYFPRGGTIEYASGEIINMESGFSFSSNGKCENLNEFKYVLNDTLINFVNSGTDNATVTFENIVSGKSGVFDKYEIKSVQKADKNLLIKIFGADRNYYFTVLDENYTMMFEPIRGNAEFTANEGKNSFLEPDTRTYSVVDFKGKILLEGLDYKSVGGFHDGLALAEDREGSYYFIDEKGNVVIR